MTDIHLSLEQPATTRPIEKSAHKKRSPNRPGSEYVVYMIVAYPMLLIGATLLRLVPGTPKYSGVAFRRPSVFREAWEMGQSALPWVFSGR